MEERNGKLLLKFKQPIEVESASGERSIVDHLLISKPSSAKLIETLAPLTTHRVLMQNTEVYVPDVEGQKVARASLVEVTGPGAKIRSFKLPDGQVLSEGMVDYFISMMSKPIEVELPWKVSSVILDSIDLGNAHGGVVEFDGTPRIMTELVVTPDGGTNYRGEGRSLSRGGEELSTVLKYSQRELTDPLVQERISEYRNRQLRSDKLRDAVTKRMIRDEGADGESKWGERNCSNVNQVVESQLSTQAQLK